MSAEASILISVAICTRNRRLFLEQAVRSVLPQLTPDTELLVMDNASTDDTGTACKQWARAAGGFAYHLEPRLGLSAARNTALKLARGKYVLFADDDAVAEPGWLDAYKNFLADPPSTKIAVLGGAVLPFYSATPPEWISLASGRFELGPKAGRMTNGCLVGANVAFLRTAALDVGGFDERLGYKGGSLIPREESELQDRLIRAGWECWWLPDAAVRHHVAVERLTIRGMAAYAFNAGRAAAIQRLKTAGTRRRRSWLRLGRLAVAPFHIAVNLLLALLMSVLVKKKRTVAALCRATRSAGWAWQSLNPLNE